MECLEFRRLLGIDPQVTDAAARAHVETCPRCQSAMAEAQEFDARLARALAVPVPDGLTDRIILAQATVQHSKANARWRRGGVIALAAAAALVLAIGIGWRNRTGTPALPALVVEHVMHGKEMAALETRTPLPDHDITAAFAARGVSLAMVPSGISYVHDCPVGPYKTVHMVMPEAGQPVSVVYVLGHRVPETTEFSREGLDGREVPIAHGTLVMLAANGASFDAIADAWRTALADPPLAAAGSL